MAKLHIFHCVCAKRLHFYYQSKLWRHPRVPRPRFPIRWRNFGDSAKSKGQIAYLSLRMRETAICLLPVKHLTSPYTCNPWPRFAIGFRNCGDSAISNGQMAYFLLRMRETAKFYFRSKIWRQQRVRRSRFSIRCRNFGHSAYIWAKLHISHCACAKRPYLYFLSKIWRRHRVSRPQITV